MVVLDWRFRSDVHELRHFPLREHASPLSAESSVTLTSKGRLSESGIGGVLVST